MKKLSAEGRFESGLDEILKGKVWCFVAVVGNRAPVALGAAVANEPGYYPIPENWANADSFGEMEDHVDELNQAEGIVPSEAIRIVCSSMKEGKAA